MKEEIQDEEDDDDYVEEGEEEEEEEGELHQPFKNPKKPLFMGFKECVYNSNYH